jgi:aminomethyltransferase
MLRDDGTVIGETTVYNLGDRYIVEVWPGQSLAVWEHVQEHARDRSDVEIYDGTTEFATVGIEGPRAYAIAQAFVDFPISVLAYKSFIAGEWEGHPLIVSRTGLTGEYGYKLLIPAKAKDLLRERLVELGATECGLLALNVCRMETRFPNLEAEAPGPVFSPFDLGIQWMVDFNKEFVGRKALKSAWERGLLEELVCFRAGGHCPVASDTPLLVDDELVGTVNFSLYSPGLDQIIGVARVRSDLAASGLELHIASDSERKRAETCSPPFLLTKSLSTRMD